jgi:signal transduction histidine kinase
VSSIDRLGLAGRARLDGVSGDVILAVFVGVLQLTITLSIAHGQEGREGIDAIAIALLLAGPVALAFHSRAPVAVLAVTVAATIAYLTLDYPRGPIVLAPIVAFFIAVIAGRRWAAWGLLLVAGLGVVYLPSVLGDAETPAPSKVLGLAVWLGLLVAAAEIARTKDERHQERERALREEGRAIANQERLRIAREVHDLLAHNVSLINVQAGTALHLLDDQPERAKPALEAIKRTSAETLDEMRSILSIMRRPGEEAPRTPTAGIGGLANLVERTSAAGIPVRTEISGEPQPVPVSVDLAVYRIVQEALTNVARHARPSGAVVRLAYQPETVTVEIDDEGRFAAAVNGGGSGIAGMRERASALGGQFAAGPRPDRGFRVRATLPLSDDDRRRPC